MLLSKAARNKRREMLATTINAAGLAAFGVGGLQPLVTGGRPTIGEGVAFVIYTVIAVALHYLAQRVLRRLED